MASIRTETVIDAPPEQVWAALRDWGALHERSFPASSSTPDWTATTGSSRSPTGQSCVKS
jgi:ligand-binding SRPBCC domain-containing protein